MALNKQKLKSRINSINSTKKITSAMELIANVKLQKHRQKVENSKEYASILKNTVSNILSKDKNIECEFLNHNESGRKLTFVFSSDMGLCGAYNSNLIKYCQTLDKSDYLIVIGKKQYSQLKSRGFNIINDEVASDNIDYSTIKNLVLKAIDLFKNKEISKIQILYTEFINTVTFIPKLEVILPFDTNNIEEVSVQEIEFEPNSNEILNHLIPMMIENTVYNYYLQSKTSEQASRRLAMETATDNAEDLSEQLLLKFNQARQASITQEITEIVSGAEAI